VRDLWRSQRRRRLLDQLIRAHGVGAITRLVTHHTHPRLTLGRALSVLDAFIDALPLDPGLLVPAGSIRRFEPTIGDLTLLAVAPDPVPILEPVLSLIPDHDVRDRTDHTLSVLFQREQINLRVIDPAVSATALIHLTGSLGHLAKLRTRARWCGYALEPDGLRETNTGNIVACETEADVYAALGLPYIPPELRHGLDELEAAELNPDALVTLRGIRGDLHVHTIWSDGRDTCETIVRSARRLGYEYVAITDHSPSARASRVLTLDRFRQQRADLRVLRERFPDIVILQGMEVDILSDGRLDFPDEVLAEMDIVLASLHEPNGQSRERLLERYLAAMRHPLVNVITHPANRVPGQSEGYDLDYDRLFRAAADTGTALEIDGAPGHLDLDGHLARRAIAAGATVAVDSDGHFAERLGRQMRMAVGTARRGGVEARHVLNARPLAEVRRFIDRKRSNRTPQAPGR
jgi:DNA polymerase (family X)